MRLSLGIFLMLAISALANAQIKNLSLSFSGNYSLNGTTTKSNKLHTTQSDPATGFTVTTVNVGSLRESYSGRPGFDFNVRGQVYQFNKFFIETGLGINYSRFKRTIEVVELPGSQVSIVPIGQVGSIGGNYGVIIGSPIGRDSLNRVIIGRQPSMIPEADEKLGETSTLYIQVPVTIGRHFWNERFQVRAGLVMSALLRATEYKPGYSYYQQPAFYAYKETSGDGFNNLLVSASTEFTYSITKQVGITTNLLHSFSGIYDENNRPGGKAKLTTVSFGMRYSLKR